MLDIVDEALGSWATPDVVDEALGSWATLAIIPLKLSPHGWSSRPEDAYETVKDS